MQITLRQRLEQFSHLNQTRLFDFLEQQAGTLTDKTKLLVSALGMLPLSRLIAPTRGWKGRPSNERRRLKRPRKGRLTSSNIGCLASKRRESIS